MASGKKFAQWRWPNLVEFILKQDNRQTGEGLVDKTSPNNQKINAAFPISQGKRRV